MTLSMLTSITRISDLAVNPFEINAIARDEWATGDYVACRVIGKPTALYRIELTSGRRPHVLEGDVIIGAFGRRAATLEYVGDWEVIGDDLQLHSLTAAGLFGKATSVSPWVGVPMRLSYVGHVTRDRKVTMRDFIKPVPPKAFALPTVMVIGTSMSAGKTITTRLIVRELKERGLKIAAAKVVGASGYKDVMTYGDAGADYLFDYVDVGLPSSVCPPDDYAEALEDLLCRIAHTDADMLVAEAGASPLEAYNGSIAVDRLSPHIKLLVLAATDAYAVLGLEQALGRKPDLVTGPASDTDATVELVKKLTGIPALNPARPQSVKALNAIIEEKLIEFVT